LQTLARFYQERIALLKKSELDLHQIDLTVVQDPYIDEKKAHPIMIIGEAPGANEVLAGEPFVGMAGKNLRALISLAGLSTQKDILITNAFPFRTFKMGVNGVKNRTPNTQELLFGATLLLQEIEIVKPNMILILGGSAKKAFLKLPNQQLCDALKQMQNHTLRQIDGLTLGLSFHPSPLVYNQPKKRKLLEDFFLNLV
jgi:uracil-DNA glycosylase